MNKIEINVSSLPPPEPMSEILKHLAILPEQYILVVTHRREPFPLYERLSVNGWAYRTIQVSQESYRIYIVRDSDKQLLAAYS